MISLKNKTRSPLEKKLATVSVVMSVYDKEQHVKKTVDSVLAQSGIEFEFIIVDDGASVAVKKILEHYRSDSRVVIVEQENQGLTKALINGCNETRYDFIARIDAGDVMTSNRLLTQAEILADQGNVGLVCSWVAMFTEEGYLLYDVKPNQEKLLLDVVNQIASDIKTPCHSSVMFRKSVYQRAGGYRSEFYFAQDCDLWARMALLCEFVVVPQFLTNCVFSQNGISGKYEKAQRQLTQLIAQGNIIRKEGKNDDVILEKASKIKPNKIMNNADSKQSNFSALYFLASCLSRSHSKYAKEYWWRAISVKPLSVLSWVKLIISLFYRKSR